MIKASNLARLLNTRNHGEHFRDWRQSGYALCQSGEGGKSIGGNYSKWPPPAILFRCRNIQHNCLKQRLIVMIYLTQFKDYNRANKIGKEGL